MSLKKMLWNLTFGRPKLYSFFRELALAKYRFKQFAFKIADVLLLPFSVLSGLLLKFFRVNGLSNFPFSKQVLFGIGIIPVVDHYYEPLFHPRHIRHSLRDDRALPGFDMNVEEQLLILDGFDYRDELMQFPIEKSSPVEFAYNGGPFGSGDSEYLYCIVRKFKPRKLIEVGAGHSTLMVRNAIDGNKREDAGYICEHICIEPYEYDWLESLGIPIIREKVECVQPNVFAQLAEDDILFIDSSHILRPQGDVLFLFQEILPVLKSGVLVHVHDIFTPKDYLDEWIFNENRFWNEQYLLEAFLCSNSSYRVVGALNFLRHHYPDEIRARLPILDAQFASREPGSFWIRKN